MIVSNFEGAQWPDDDISLTELQVQVSQKHLPSVPEDDLCLSLTLLPTSVARYKDSDRRTMRDCALRWYHQLHSALCAGLGRPAGVMLTLLVGHQFPGVPAGYWRLLLTPSTPTTGIERAHLIG